jgi:glycosyltransferase involved in cell wall biosynthesis
MRITLIIITYNRPDFLDVVLHSIEKQSELPYEVIIADDGSAEETLQLIEKRRTRFPVPLLHAWHPDAGFRIAKIRNEAIKISEGDYFIFSDGDLVLHPRFIEDFRKNARAGEALIGSRVFLSSGATFGILKTGNINFRNSLFTSAFEKNRINALRISFLSFLFPAEPYKKKLRGGLLGVWKKDLIEVNGWNEDFEGWGLEDSEFLVRLHNNGTKFRKMKFRAITYHLWHTNQKRERLSENRELLENSIRNKAYKCKNGLNLN